jgi:dephospho-CoA kinase
VPIIGLTGGVATGKSTFARRLLSELPTMETFDSDRCVHELLASDESVHAAIANSFGPSIFDSNGIPDRVKLRGIVFDDESRRRELESILHPLVRTRWQGLVRQARQNRGWLLVDIPLLYETGSQVEFDRVIVVASPSDTQLRRMIHERGLAPTVAAKIISTQLDIGAKTQLADHVIWNDSTVSNLDGQSRLLAAWLRRRFS